MHSRRWILLATVSVALLLITLDNSILYTALPTLTEELGASDSESLWIINAYPLVMCGLLLGTGTLGDKVGHVRMFVVGLVIFGLASVLAAYAPNTITLIVSRGVLAVGAAAMMPATLALIRLVFTDTRERNLAIGVWGSISIVGMALGPILSGVLLENFWWGSVFIIKVPVVVLALLVVPFVMPKNDADPSRSWDLFSSVLALVTLSGFVLFIKEAAHVDANGWVVLISGALTVVGAILFVRRQRRLEYPLVDFAVFKNPAFSAGMLGAVLAMFAIAGIQLMTTQRFQLVEGFSPLESGMLLVAVAIGSLPTALLGGAFLHVTGLRFLITGGIAVTAAGSALLAGSIGTSFSVVVIALLIVGAGMGMITGVASTAIVGNVPRSRSGMAASLEEVSYEFGSLLAVAILGSLLTTFYSVFVSLPAGAPAEAGESLNAAIVAADGDQAILTAAYSAFESSFQAVAIIITAVMVLGGAATARLLRSYGWGTPSTLSDDDEGTDTAQIPAPATGTGTGTGTATATATATATEHAGSTAPMPATPQQD